MKSKEINLNNCRIAFPDEVDLDEFTAELTQWLWKKYQGRGTVAAFDYKSRLGCVLKSEITMTKPEEPLA